MEGGPREVHSKERVETLKKLGWMDPKSLVAFFTTHGQKMTVETLIEHTKAMTFDPEDRIEMTRANQLSAYIYSPTGILKIGERLKAKWPKRAEAIEEILYEYIRPVVGE